MKPATINSESKLLNKDIQFLNNKMENPMAKLMESQFIGTVFD